MDNGDPLFLPAMKITNNVNKLVYYEIHSEITEAIRREKNLKKWNRKWKIELIEKANSSWKDLYSDII